MDDGGVCENSVGTWSGNRSSTWARGVASNTKKHHQTGSAAVPRRVQLLAEVAHVRWEIVDQPVGQWEERAAKLAVASPSHIVLVIVVVPVASVVAVVEG